MSFLLSPIRRTSTTILTHTARATTARTFSTTRPSHLARMTLVGRLGADPEVVETSKGSLVKYVIGTSYGPRENRQTSWFRVTNFSEEGTRGRELVLGLGKGTLVYLEADARMQTYDDKNGDKQSSLSLVQTKLEVMKRPTPKDEQGGIEAPIGV